MKDLKRDTGVASKAAGRIANGILKVQARFAAWMGRLSVNWSRKQQWIFLLCTCGVFIVLSIVAIVKPFSTTVRATAGPAKVVVPKNIPREQPSYSITTIEFKKVQAYKQLHPRLQKERPGLYDSLTLIEQLYYSQQK